MDVGKLAMMANQIARNLAFQGEAAAVRATARHIRDFWDPRMIATLLAADQAMFSDIVRGAVRQLAEAEDENCHPRHEA